MFFDQSGNTIERVTSTTLEPVIISTKSNLVACGLTVHHQVVKPFFAVTSKGKSVMMPSSAIRTNPPIIRTNCRWFDGPILQPPFNMFHDAHAEASGRSSLGEALAESRRSLAKISAGPKSQTFTKWAARPARLWSLNEKLVHTFAYLYKIPCEDFCKSSP